MTSDAVINALVTAAAGTNVCTARVTVLCEVDASTSPGGGGTPASGSSTTPVVAAASSG